jgi:pyridoxine/pyridoxamine 5'-phosphate oxidase
MQKPASINPVEKLRAERARARENEDPCASLCTVASVDEEGFPQARTLVLRDVQEQLAIFGNETSPKWQQMPEGTVVAVVVWLPSLSLQYRLRCTTRPVATHVVHQSWQLRPATPKKLDWLYTHHQPQSTPVADRATLLGILASLDLPEPLIAPDTAAGLFLTPHVIDRLDLDQPDGVHDRRHFERTDRGWLESVLVP